MSVYQTLRNNPPKLAVVKNPQKILINLVSVMCDNRYQFTFYKKEDGDWGLNTHGSAYSNFQIKCSKPDLLWMADDGDWDEIFRLINTGVQKIESVRSR